MVYLTQNLFPRGKACRDIALNTQYMVLFNNPIDRQPMATRARKIHPSTSAIFMKRFEQATPCPYGYLIIDVKSVTHENDRLHTDLFDRLNSEEEEMAVIEESAQAEVWNKEEEETEEDEDSTKKKVTFYPRDKNIRVQVKRTYY